MITLFAGAATRDRVLDVTPILGRAVREVTSVTVLEYQRQAVAVAGKLDWVRCPGGIKIRPERVFVFEPIESAGRGIIRRN